MKRAVAKWAEENRLRLGFSQERIGKALNVSQPQARLRLRGEMEFSLEEIGILEKLFGTSVPLRGNSSLAESGELREISLRETVMIPVSGAVQAGRWLDRNDEAAYEMDKEFPGSPRFPAESQRAYRVIGESLNRTAKPDSILMAVDCIAEDVEIKDGDLVIVERSQYNGQKVEVTAKRIRKTLSGYELWPESDDPRYQEPIALNGAEDHEEIRVAAKVLWIINEP